MSNSDATPPDVIVGELALVDGQRRADVAHMALLTPPRRARGDRRSETVLVFLDLGVQGESGLARAMLEHFNRTYWRSSGPVTSALRDAINAANAHLREENRLVPVSHRRRGGLVCAVLRGDCVYLAQIGPAKVLLVRDGEAMWYAQRRKGGLPLGVSSGLDLQFAYSDAGTGDRLLLTGENWSDELQDGTLEEALRAENVADIMLELEGQAAFGDFSALVVECAWIEESPQHAETTQSPLPAATRTDSESRARQEPLGPETIPATSVIDSLDLLPEEPITPVLKPAPTVYAGYEASETVDWGEIDLTPPVSDRLAYDTVAVADLETEDEWGPSQRRFAFSVGGDRLSQSGQGLRRFFTALSGGARSSLARVLPEPDVTLPRHKRHAKGASAENVPLMAGIAVGIPLLVAFLVVTFYLQRGDAQRQGSVALQVHEAFELAKASEGENERALWYAALEAAEGALQDAPEDLEILAVRDQSRAHLDELESVLRPELAQLWDYGAGSGRRVSTSRSQVYVLDTTQDEVNQQAIDQPGEGADIVKPSLVTYGDHSVGGDAIGGLRDIIWLSAAGSWTSDALLILTEDNRLLQHNPSWGLSWVALESDLTPENVRVLRPYDGKLYALDPVQNQVWRFRYAEDVFGPPEGYFRVPVPDLSDAVDMAVDGAVYILLANGEIYRFFGGEPEPYEIRGLPNELSRPVALVSEGDATSGALYIADAGTKSIIVLTKDGEFVNQFRADGDLLDSLEALAIETDGRSLIAVSNGRVIKMALPPLPAPDGEPD